MVKISVNVLFVLSAFTLLSSAAPMLQKRIAQDTPAAKAAWEAACTTAGGAPQCNIIAVKAISTLLAAADPCAQQDSADEMIDLAKQLGNDPEMIRLAQLFVQQPRNAPDSLQVPYCQKAPKNAELNGLFHCQFAGSKFPQFSGDQTGNIPLGVSAVNPPGSCPAKPDGPVPDGVQLNTLVQEPVANGGAAPAPASSPAASPAPASSNNAGGAAAGASSVAPNTLAASGAKPFTLQNGKDAKALNAKFASLTPNSPCNDGESACVGTSFAQCVGGKFVSTQCAGGTICAALPLVNSPGTSITCTTAADRDARIAATGA